MQAHKNMLMNGAKRRESEGREGNLIFHLSLFVIIDQSGKYQIFTSERKNNKKKIRNWAQQCNSIVEFSDRQFICLFVWKETQKGHFPNYFSGLKKFIIFFMVRTNGWRWWWMMMMMGTRLWFIDFFRSKWVLCTQKKRNGGGKTTLLSNVFQDLMNELFKEKKKTKGGSYSYTAGIEPPTP